MSDASASSRSFVATGASLRWLTRPLAVLGIMIALGFSMLAVEYAFALAAGRPALMVRLIALAVSQEFVFGARATTAYMVGPYSAVLGRISTHMVLGSAALGLGALQFVPAARRRTPRLHRIAGLFVWIATAISMLAALAFLEFIPPRQDASGPAFHLGLWSLSVLTILMLWQAVAAVRRRDFRSHMVWMATVYAALCTAPALRIGWVLWAGATGLDQETVNLASGMFVFLATLTVMTFWLYRVGDRDLPARVAPLSRWPLWLLHAQAVASAGAAVMLALPVTFFGEWRQATDLLPRGAFLWALGTILVMLGSAKTWQAALRGMAPSRSMTLAIGVVAIGAIAIGLEHDRSSLARYASASYWIGYALILIAGILVAHRAPLPSTGRNVGALITLALLWLPSQLPSLLWMGRLAGADFDAAMAAALVNGSGGIAVAGIATGFGAKLGFG